MSESQQANREAPVETDSRLTDQANCKRSWIIAVSVLISIAGIMGIVCCIKMVFVSHYRTNTAFVNVIFVCLFLG